MSSAASVSGCWPGSGYGVKRINLRSFMALFLPPPGGGRVGVGGTDLGGSPPHPSPPHQGGGGEPGTAAASLDALQLVHAPVAGLRNEFRRSFLPSGKGNGELIV